MLLNPIDFRSPSTSSPKTVLAGLGGNPLIQILPLEKRCAGYTKALRRKYDFLATASDLDFVSARAKQSRR
jgi:hypothetical protein